MVYRPDTERMSHYSQAYLHMQFDRYICFDRTEAVQPFRDHPAQNALGNNETYPFGL